jgi:hypothetical protein
MSLDPDGACDSREVVGLRYLLDRRFSKAERIVFDLADAEEEAVEHRRKGASDD